MIGSSSIDAVHRMIFRNTLLREYRFRQGRIFGKQDSLVAAHAAAIHWPHTVLNSLSRNELERIVEIQVARLQRLLAERDVVISLSQEAKSWLAAEGFDPVYGARSLKRVITKQLKDRLAVSLLEGRHAGPAEVRVGLKDGALEFDIRTRPSAD